MMPFSLFLGLLLMTLTNSSPDLSEYDPGDTIVLTDFTSAGSDLGWYVMNDNVMGGRSEGDFEAQQGTLNFTGRTNTNGGGFSSIRTKPLQLDLSKYAGIQLHVTGDGRRYTWQLTTPERWRGRQVSYWADFETSNGSASVVNIPFSSFVPKYRGYQLDGPALDPRQITGMGLMIYDKQDGPFELQLADVGAYSASTPFSLQQYRWENRVLIVSAANEADENLRAQQTELALSSAEFKDRDMLLVTLLDTAVSTAEGRELTTAEVHAARTSLGIRPGSFAVRLIGKDGSIKLSEETATPMTKIYSLIDSMPMRQRETLERQ